MVRRPAAVLGLLALIGCAAEPSREGLGSKCSTEADCSYGQTCFGWGGFNGQTIYSCEIPCTPDNTHRSQPADVTSGFCPGEMQCVCVRDGPCPVCQ